MKTIYAEELHLYASCKGFRVTYYGDLEAANYPIVDRIEPFFPGRFDQYYR